MDLEEIPTTDRLRLLGLGHRVPENRAPGNFAREVYEMESGRVVGRFTAFEATDLCRSMEAERLTVHP